MIGLALKQTGPVTLLGKSLRLSGEDRGLVLRAVLLVGAIRLGLAVLSFRTLQQALARLAQPLSNPQGSRVGSTDRLLWAIRRASLCVPGASCLTQALAAQVLLARHGHQADLRIGVARDLERRLQAHAWLEQGGRVLLGADEGRAYTLLEGLDWPPPRPDARWPSRAQDHSLSSQGAGLADSGHERGHDSNILGDKTHELTGW